LVTTDATKHAACYGSHDLFPGGQCCVRKKFSTYFISLKQWKITHTVDGIWSMTPFELNIENSNNYHRHCTMSDKRPKLVQKHWNCMVSKYCLRFRLHALFWFGRLQWMYRSQRWLRCKVVEMSVTTSDSCQESTRCMGAFSDGTIPLGYAEQYGHQHETKE